MNPVKAALKPIHEWLYARLPNRRKPRAASGSLPVLRRDPFVPKPDMAGIQSAFQKGGPSIIEQARAFALQKKKDEEALRLWKTEKRTAISIMWLKSAMTLIDESGLLKQDLVRAVLTDTRAGDDAANLAGKTAQGASLGAAVGTAIPGVGNVVGTVVGAIGGAVVGFFENLTKGDDLIRIQWAIWKTFGEILKQAGPPPIVVALAVGSGAYEQGLLPDPILAVNRMILLAKQLEGKNPDAWKLVKPYKADGIQSLIKYLWTAEDLALGSPLMEDPTFRLGAFPPNYGPIPWEERAICTFALRRFLPAIYPMAEDGRLDASEIERIGKASVSFQNGYQDNQKKIVPLVGYIPSVFSITLDINKEVSQ